MKRVLILALFVLSFSAALIAQTATIPAGSGTSGDPYQIASLENLYWLTQSDTAFGSYFIQTADINAASTNGWDGGLGFLPIGKDPNHFTGHYDGNGKTITGVYINRNINFDGFFSQTDAGSTISNLGLVNLTILVGGNVTGGLVASNSAAITNCYTTGTVTGNQYVGGLLGESANGAISGSFSTCTVAAVSQGAGLVGLCGSAVSNCYSRGDVTRKVGSTFVDLGPFVGVQFAGQILNSYSTGRLIYAGATDPTDRGFLSDIGGGTNVSDFWDTETSLQATSEGTAVGAPTATLKNQSTFLDAGWSAVIWNMDPAINDGYPYLQWQNTEGTPLPIQLASLTAAPTGGSSVTLNWKTASEVNNYGFYVQRSAAAKTGFADVSSLIPGHGTSTTGFSYTYADKSAPAGIAYYRLKQVDLDNSVHYSDAVTSTPTGVAVSAPIVFALNQNYPNPFNPSTEFRFTVAKSGLTTLVVYNALGQEVAQIFNGLTESGQYYTARLDGTGLASGVYFARLQSGTESQLKKIILMK